MVRDIPLKSAKPKQSSTVKQDKTANNVDDAEEVTPYDIILENVELSYEKIPSFM